jgi:hypothetical protein
MQHLLGLQQRQRAIEMLDIRLRPCVNCLLLYDTNEGLEQCRCELWWLGANSPNGFVRASCAGRGQQPPHQHRRIGIPSKLDGLLKPFSLGGCASDPTGAGRW